jgi:hypothetical protein
MDKNIGDLDRLFPFPESQDSDEFGNHKYIMT